MSDDASEKPAALITGASRGIGRALAQKLAARGVRVVVHFRDNRSAAEKTLQELPGSGHALAQADLQLPEAPEQLFRAALNAVGRLDLLVNNAGIFEAHPIGEVSFEEWRRAWERTLAINLRAPADLTFLAAEHMRARGGGRIINISSRGAFGGQIKTPAYSASKAALNSLGHSFAQALARQNVLVFAIAPGWVDTEMVTQHIHGERYDEVRRNIPLGRVNTADDVATTAAWLALDAPATMTGCIVDMNGGVLMRP